MAATATTDLIETLRYTYADTDRVLYLFNQETNLFNRLKKKMADLGGRGQFLMPILNKNAGAWKGIAQGGSLPSALQPDSSEASYALQEFVGIYDISWKLIQDGRNSKFAFENVIKQMDQSVSRRIFRLINADLLGDGRGQLLALAAADNTDPLTSRYLPRCEVGMLVDFMDDSDDDTFITSGAVGGRTVSAIDPIARTVTITTNGSGTAANDYLTVAGTCDISVTTTSKHLNGMLGLISNANPTVSAVVGNVGGINRSTAGNEYWQSAVLSNGGTNRLLNEDLLLQAEDAVREKGGASLTDWWSNLAIGRRYHEILRNESYYSLGRVNGLDGGVGRSSSGAKGSGADGDGGSIYDFSGVQWHFDPFFEANTVIGFDREHFFIGHGENELPMPISKIFPDKPFFKDTSSATYEVLWYWQGQAITDNPAAGVKVSDIAES
jgi:hypothetical protein